MADVFAEIDDAMRQERIARLWNEYGSVLITFLICLILGTAAISGFKAWNTGVKEKQTNMILNYIDPDNTDPAAFAAASEDMRPGLRGLSLLIAAGQALDNGDNELALSIYKQAAADSSIPVSLRDLAILMDVRLQAQTDQAPPAERLLSELKTVWSNRKSPWNAHARLEAAILEAHMKNDFTAAQEHLKIVQSMEDAAQSVQQRAQALSHVYALRQQEKAE